MCYNFLGHYLGGSINPIVLERYITQRIDRNLLKKAFTPTTTETLQFYCCGNPLIPVGLIGSPNFLINKDRFQNLSMIVNLRNLVNDRE